LTEIVATIVKGLYPINFLCNVEGMNAWYAVSDQHKEQNPNNVPFMMFSGLKGHPVMAPHNNPSMIELKVLSTLDHRILIGIGSSADIIT